ncbi:transmembrane protein 45B-like [Babylonia areolata]|uniref:transmembrane protein 45B-like n=1 Tax=Babylonia areolata TaxID=304850 RepID=UPI003FD475F5
MGSFWGHIDEGIFFILLAVWWIVNACYHYVLSQHHGKPMEPRLSYSVYWCKREIPVEIIFKILFPLAGFLAEFLDGGVALLDEDGNFRKLVYAQHMTIYGIFLFHALLDLLTWLGLPMIPGAGHASAALSFLWYGVAFYYHAQMHGKEPLETVVHVLPISAMLVTAGAILLELAWRRGVWTMLTRSLGLLTLGTWFSHVAFMLYEHDKFPGGGSSGWDRSDLRNVQFARASFGLHLLFNMLFIVLCYVITYLALRLRHKVRLDVTYDDSSDDALALRHTPCLSGDGSDAMLLEDCA